MDDDINICTVKQQGATSTYQPIENTIVSADFEARDCHSRDLKKRVVERAAELGVHEHHKAGAERSAKPGYIA
ncbi:hypothetical protein E4U36_001664 [Claviceps purpurea]|nr:hypothetical protein E4U36_001664 [Claviceps purpurea]